MLLVATDEPGGRNAGRRLASRLTTQANMRITAQGERMTKETKDNILAYVIIFLMEFAVLFGIINVIIKGRAQ